MSFTTVGTYTVQYMDHARVKITHPIKLKVIIFAVFFHYYGIGGHN